MRSRANYQSARPYSSPLCAQVQRKIYEINSLKTFHYILLIRTYVSLDVADVTVRLGALDLRLRNQNERNFTVETVLVHEDYNKTSLEHDLALVKLTTKVDYTDIIHPICIPDETLPTELKSAFAAGWGRTVPKGPVSNILQKVQVTVVQHVQCKAIYKSLKRNIFDSQLCAGDRDGTKDTCQVNF